MGAGGDKNVEVEATVVLETGGDLIVPERPLDQDPETLESP